MKAELAYLTGTPCPEDAVNAYSAHLFRGEPTSTLESGRRLKAFMEAVLDPFKYAYDTKNPWGKKTDREYKGKKEAPAGWPLKPKLHKDVSA